MLKPSNGTFRRWWGQSPYQWDGRSFFSENLLIFGCPGSSSLSRLSLVSANSGYSPVAVHGLLLVAASPPQSAGSGRTGCSSCSMWAQELGSSGDQYSHKWGPSQSSFTSLAAGGHSKKMAVYDRKWALTGYRICRHLNPEILSPQNYGK